MIVLSRLYTEVEVYMGIWTPKALGVQIHIYVYTDNKVYNRFKLWF